VPFSDEQISYGRHGENDGVPSNVRGNSDDQDIAALAYRYFVDYDSFTLGSSPASAKSGKVSVVGGIRWGRTKIGQLSSPRRSSPDIHTPNHRTSELERAHMSLRNSLELRIGSRNLTLEIKALRLRQTMQAASRRIASVQGLAEILEGMGRAVLWQAVSSSPARQTLGDASASIGEQLLAGTHGHV